MEAMTRSICVQLDPSTMIQDARARGARGQDDPWTRRRTHALRVHECHIVEATRSYLKLARQSVAGESECAVRVDVSCVLVSILRVFDMCDQHGQASCVY